LKLEASLEMILKDLLGVILNRALTLAVFALISLVTPQKAQAEDLQLESLAAEQEALRARIKAIEIDQKASLVEFQSDKKRCASTVLVSRCTSEALVRRRARDAVLRDGQISAKEQLRSLSAKEKNADLAANLARAEQEAMNDAKREESQNQRAKKLADAQERLESHQKKKAQEQENRRLYLEKLKRAEEKQAEIRARFKASGARPEANTLANVPSPTGLAPGSAGLGSAPITSAN
jgi:hypothetical protein